MQCTAGTGGPRERAGHRSQDALLVGKVRPAAVNHDSPLSSSAKADDPVNLYLICLTSSVVVTGSPLSRRFRGDDNSELVNTGGLPPVPHIDKVPGDGGGGSHGGGDEMGAALVA